MYPKTVQLKINFEFFIIFHNFNVTLFSARFSKLTIFMIINMEQNYVVSYYIVFTMGNVSTIVNSKRFGNCIALPIEDRERNLTKSILARVCTLNVCGYSTLLRSVQ